jgi:hypothetical protein
MPKRRAVGRRLSDKLLVAFHQACDQADIEVAEQLLRILEIATRRHSGSHDRRKRESLVPAYKRLWLLRHPTSGPDGE